MFAIFLILFPFFVLSEDPSLDGSEIITKIHFVAPNIQKDAYLVMYFNSPSDISKKLIVSQARKDGIDESLSKYDGIWSVEVPETSAIEGDYALVLKSQAKHHAVSMKLDKPIKFDTNEVVIQYEVKYQDKIDCGGAYIKLISSPSDLKNFNDVTPYTIMFGPDKCGLDDKFHLIIRYRNPKSGVIEEKHAKKITSSLEQYFSDRKSHLYTLVLRSDNSFERYIDQVLVQTGNLLSDLEPPINPPIEIDDPVDKKPADWDDRKEIADETATKPSDWDDDAPELIEDESVTKPDGWLDNESEMIPDPSSKPPVDWDQEMDGKWDAPKIKNPKCENAPGCGEFKLPLIRNPKFKSKWVPPFIPNPDFKGVWKQAKILNPDYFVDKHPFKNLAEVSALGLELWSMTSEVAFDNFLIADSKRVADDFAAQTWSVKQKAEKLADPKAKSVFDAVQETYNEKPWLIFLIGLVCTLPILLCCVYFCRSPKRTSVIHKKTDEFTPAEHVKNSPKSTDEELDESIEDDIISVSKGSGDDSDAQIRGTGDDSTEDGVGAENENSLKSKQNLRRRSRKE